MAPKKSSLRYAHSEGQCDLCYDETGRYIITGGSEGDVRIWQKDSDDDDDDFEAESHRVGDRVLSIAVRDGKLYSAIENNTVQIHSFPQCEPDGLATRFTAAVNHVRVSRDGRWLVAGSSDFTVKVVSLTSSIQKVLTGHLAPILSVALDGDGVLAASSSCDGTVRVWTVKTESCLHTVENVLKKCSDVSLAKSWCRLEFTPKYLLIPVGKEIQIFNRQWEKVKMLECDNDVSIVTMSHCNKYLAAATITGGISVWNFESKKLLLGEKHEENLGINSLKWHPKKYQLSYCDTSGQFGQIDDVIGDEDEDDNEGLTADQYANLFDDEADDVDFSKVIEKAKETGKNDADSDIDMDEGDINEVLAEMSDGDGDDENPARPSSRPSSVMSDDNVSHSSDKSAPKVLVHSHTDCFKPTPLQRPFQPRSTPAHLAQRFMIWNHVGIIRQYRTDDENSIEVEFHDSSVHHRMTVGNDLDHSMADMNAEAVVLANEDGHLVCMHFNTWDNAKEWTIDMPKGEKVTALALGSDFISVATDRRLVRIFSIGGIQKHLLCISGPVLTMAAYLDKLMIVYHRGAGVPGDQCLQIIIIDLESKTSNECPLPLAPRSTLSYLGFSDEGTPFALDSHGILRMFNEKFARTWIPIACTSEHLKGKTDSFWIVGVSESLHQIRCILCKGSMYPPVLPRPSISLLPFKIPLCEQDKSMIEETYLKTQLAMNFFEEIDNEGLKKETDLQERESLMKLFALSCKQGHEFRALEVCKLMPDYQTVQLAIRYASRLRLIHLAEKLNELARVKMDEEFEKTYKENDIENKNPVNEKEEGEEVEITGPMLMIKKDTPKSLLSSQNEERKNPFKTNNANRSSVGKGSSIFDGISKESKKEKDTKSPFGRATVELKKSTAKKTKQKEIITKPIVSAFDIWYKCKVSELAEEHPDASDEERAKLGVSLFRQLSKEEKEVWKEKARKVGDAGSDLKRKRDDMDVTDSKKVCT